MKGKMLSKLLLPVVSLLLMFGCASAPRVQDATTSENFGVITDIKVQDNGLAITSNKPFIYTLYSANDPYRVTLDIPDMKAGNFKDKIVFDKAGITDITPHETDSPKPAVKFDILFQNPSTVVPIYDNNTLLLTLKREEPAASTPQTVSADASSAPSSKSAEEGNANTEPKSTGGSSVKQSVDGTAGEPPKAAAEETASDDTKASSEAGQGTEAKAPEESVPPMARATEISKVEIKKSMERVNVSITGNGSMKPNVFPLDGRIVVDIPGVVMKAPVPSGFEPPLKGIRVGKYKDKVRLVLDLRKRTNFDVEAKGNSIEILLGRKVLAAAKPSVPDRAEEVPSAEPAPGETPAAKPAAAEASHEGKTPEKAVPAGITVTPESGDQGGARFNGEKISLDFQDAEVGQIIRLLADTHKPEPYNLVLDPSIKGKRIPNLKLMNVPWDQALDIILKSADFSYRIEGNVLWVAPASAFAKLAEDKEKAKEAESKSEELVQAIVQVNYAEAENVSKAITDAKLLSPRGNITRDARMNTLIIKDTKKSIDKVKELVKIMDVAKPQVMIEAKLVQVSNDYNESLGIRWGGAINNPSFPTPVNGNFSVNTPTDAAGSNVKVPGGALGLTVGHANTLRVDLSLSALESLSKAKTLSNPKILTMDNEKATIQQGTTFFIPTVSQAGTQTQAQTATLSLEVTPKITPDGYVQIKVTATDNSLEPGTSGADAVVDTKSMTTQALVKNGETLVLGGIYTTTKTETENGVPILSSIPGLGWLFKTKSITGPTVKELLIFITPTIITQPM